MHKYITCTHGKLYSDSVLTLYAASFPVDRNVSLTEWLMEISNSRNMLSRRLTRKSATWARNEYFFFIQSSIKWPKFEFSLLHPFYRALFTWAPKAICVYFSFVLLRLSDWLKKTHATFSANYAIRMIYTKTNRDLLAQVFMYLLWVLIGQWIALRNLWSVRVIILVWVLRYSIETCSNTTMEFLWGLLGPSLTQIPLLTSWGSCGFSRWLICFWISRNSAP